MNGLEDIIRNALNEPETEVLHRILEMFEFFQKHQYLMTPQAISKKEETAKHEIWVVTNHLYNDTQDPETRESVKRNLKRGIRYRYFVDMRNPLIAKRIPEYKKLYAAWSDQYEFFRRSSGLFMPYDELVLYDPIEPNHMCGYAQMNYPIPGKEDDNLFLRLSDAHSLSIAFPLKSLVHKSRWKGSTK